MKKTEPSSNTPGLFELKTLRHNDQDISSDPAPPKESVIEIEEPPTPKVSAGYLPSTLPRSHEPKLTAFRASQQESYSRFVRSILFEENESNSSTRGNKTSREEELPTNTEPQINGVGLSNGENLSANCTPSIGLIGNESSAGELSPPLPPRIQTIPGTSYSPEFLPAPSHLESTLGTPDNGQFFPSGVSQINTVPKLSSKQESIYQNEISAQSNDLKIQRALELSFNQESVYQNQSSILATDSKIDRTSEPSLSQESLYRNQNSLQSRDLKINRVSPPSLNQESVYQNQVKLDNLNSNKYLLTNELQCRIPPTVPDSEEVLSNSIPQNHLNLENSLNGICTPSYTNGVGRSSGSEDSLQTTLSRRQRLIEQSYSNIIGLARESSPNKGQFLQNVQPYANNRIAESTSSQESLKDHIYQNQQNERLVNKDRYSLEINPVEFRLTPNDNFSQSPVSQSPKIPEPPYSNIPPPLHLQSSPRPLINGQFLPAPHYHNNRFAGSTSSQESLRSHISQNHQNERISSAERYSPANYFMQYRSIPRNLSGEFLPQQPAQLQPELPYTENFTPVSTPPSNRVGRSSGSEESLRNFASQYSRLSGSTEAEKSSPIPPSHFGAIPKRSFTEEVVPTFFSETESLSGRSNNRRLSNSHRGKASSGSEDSFRSTFSHSRRLSELSILNAERFSPNSSSQFRSLQGSVNSRDFSPDSSSLFRSIQGSSNSREISPTSSTQLQKISGPTSSQESLRSSISLGRRVTGPPNPDRLSPRSQLKLIQKSSQECPDSTSQLMSHQESPSSKEYSISPNSASQIKRVSGGSSSQDSLRSSQNQKATKPSGSQDFLLASPSQVDSLLQPSKDKKPPAAPVSRIKPTTKAELSCKKSFLPDLLFRSLRKSSGRSSGEESFKSASSRSKKSDAAPVKKNILPNSQKKPIPGAPSVKKFVPPPASQMRVISSDSTTSSSDEYLSSHGSHKVIIEKPPSTVRFRATPQFMTIPSISKHSSPSSSIRRISSDDSSSSSDDSLPDSHIVRIEESPPKSKEASPKRAPQIKSILRRSTTRRTPPNVEESYRYKMDFSDSSSSDDSLPRRDSPPKGRVVGRRKCPIMPHAQAVESSSETSDSQDNQDHPQPTTSSKTKEEFKPTSTNFVRYARDTKTENFTDRELLAMELRRFARALEEPYSPSRAKKQRAKDSHSSSRSQLKCSTKNHDATYCSKCLKDVADIVLNSYFGDLS